MADYYPLIARAVAGLDKNSGENRRALYDRARSALVNQLRGVDPPLDESDITRERLALEEAIRRLEAEAAKRTRPDAADAPDADEYDDGRQSLGDHGLRDFRDTVAEIEGLGGASAEANRAARAAYDDVPGRHDYATGQHGQQHAQQNEHYFEPPGGEHPAQHGGGMPGEHPSDLAPPPVTDEDDYARPPRSYGGVIKVILLLLLVGGVAAGVYWQRASVLSAAKSAMAMVKSSPKPAPAKPAATSEPSARPKIADRIGSSDAPSEKPATARRRS